MLRFIRNEGFGRVYEAEIDQGALGVVTGMQVWLKCVALGALYYDGTELARPTRPWDGTFRGQAGNIPAFHGDMNKYSFGPATSEETVLYWHKFIDYEQNKTLLICDRNIVRSISWDHINSGGFIYGKEIELEGQGYKCRVLTGGKTDRRGSQTEGTGYSGGRLPNEWDRYIMNGADVGEPIFGDAPTPIEADYPSSSLREDSDAWARPHNRAWNWITMYSWCQEKLDDLHRSQRGRATARYWRRGQRMTSSTTRGWRPVLELID